MCGESSFYLDIVESSGQLFVIMASPDAFLAHLPSVPSHATQFERELESLFSEVNALSLVLNRTVHLEFAEGELSAGEKSVLQILKRRGPQTVPQIARARSTSRQNIQIQVNRMARQGCVEIKINPAHKRSALLYLSAHGGRLLSAAEQQQNQLSARLEPLLVEDQLRTAVEVLRKVRDLLEQPQPARVNHEPIPDARNQGPALPAAAALSDEPAKEELALPVNLL
jgi:DNA-binding MarR family transcriptional regulator